MRAVVVEDGAVRVAERPDPEPGPDEVLVAVAAAGLNNADLLQRAGLYPAPKGSPPDIPGLELAGEVRAVGESARRFHPGDRVMGLVGGGGQAEFVTLDERHLLAVPSTLPWEAAGGFVEAFATAHDALFAQGALAAGERVLVQGGAGGVGVAAIQLAREAGAEVVATVRAAERRGQVAALGAEALAPEDVADAGPFDVVVELVGGDNLTRDVSLLRTGGRLVVVGTGAGSRREIDFLQLMQRRGTIRGATLRARPADAKALVVAALAKTVEPLLATGRLTVPLHAVYALEKVERAYEAFAAGGKFGKIVLRLGGA